MFRSLVFSLLAALGLGMNVIPAIAASKTEDQEIARRWVAAHFSETDTAQIPFSFVYGGKSSRELLPNWKLQKQEKTLDGGRREITLMFAEPGPGLEVRVVAVADEKHPAVEWTLYFRNAGKKPTPILEKILAVDTGWELPGTKLSLRYANGSNTSADSYRPMLQPLLPGEPFRLASKGGRPAYGPSLPYGCLETDQEVVVYAIGWPGQWALTAEAAKQGQVRLQAGQEVTHFRLERGEEVRTPLIALLFYRGTSIQGSNLWRRWMVDRNLPRANGEILGPILVANSSHLYNEMLNANEKNQIEMIDRYVEEKLPLRYWWMDAGWYVNDGKWVNTGTWEIDKKRFPKGFRPITDHGRAKGVKSIVWFEPERVTTNSWIFQKHPEWCLAPTNLPAPLAYQGEWRLLNLGNPKAWKWLVDHVDGLIKKEGIDLYRQDFNMDPLCFWQANEATDRQGINENRHVTGYLAYWDELLRRNPGLRIDSCASGGRRNDLETMRRAVPLLRDDYLFEPTGQQNHSYGISFWLPYSGTGTRFTNKSAGPASSVADAAHKEDSKFDPYLFRSQMTPCLNACWDVRRRDFDYDQLRRALAQFERASPSFLADYYPLTPYSAGDDAVVAWQFNRPESGQGFVQAFRRPKSDAKGTKLKLQGLETGAKYEIENLDGGKQTRTGRELMEQGLTVNFPAAPAALLFIYQRVGPKNQPH